MNKGSAEAVLEVFGKWVGDDSEEILDLIKVYRDRKMNPDIQKILVELRHRFEDIYGERLVNMLLFGSQARGDATSESDIDVMVILKGTVNPSEEINRISETRAELSLKNDAVISCIFMSAERYAIEQSPLILNAHREGIAI